MVDLGVKFAGWRIKSPVMAAPADNTNAASMTKLVKNYVENGVGCIFLKTNESRNFWTEFKKYPMLDAASSGKLYEELDVPTHPFVRPQYYPFKVNGVTAGLYCNSSGARYPAEYSPRLIEKIKKDLPEDVPLISSILSRGWIDQNGEADQQALEDWVHLVRVALEAEVDGIELNIGCPTRWVDISIVTQEKSLNILLDTLRREIGKTTFGCKLIPVTFLLGNIVKTCEKAGAQWVASDVPLAAPPINVWLGKPMLTLYPSFLCGPATKPTSQANCLVMAKAVSNPKTLHVVGAGGISTWNDVIEYVMLGARAVYLSYGIMLKGPRAIKELNAGIRNFLEKKGISNIEELQGSVLPFMLDQETMERDLGKKLLGRLIAVTDRSKCSGCGVCVDACYFGAIELGKDGLARTIHEYCEGCNLCTAACPEGARRLNMDMDQIYKLAGK